jgi:hypothetical protein
VALREVGAKLPFGVDLLIFEVVEDLVFGTVVDEPLEEIRVEAVCSHNGYGEGRR